jgi:hypothetical protein
LQFFLLLLALLFALRSEVSSTPTSKSAVCVPEQFFIQGYFYYAASSGPDNPNRNLSDAQVEFVHFARSGVFTAKPVTCRAEDTNDLVGLERSGGGVDWSGAPYYLKQSTNYNRKILGLK